VGGRLRKISRGERKRKKQRKLKTESYGKSGSGWGCLTKGRGKKKGGRRADAGEKKWGSTGLGGGALVHKKTRHRQAVQTIKCLF